MRILLIEDDAKMADYIAKGLAQEGCQIDHAADGIEGLAKAAAGTYDVAVVDIMLPRLDGLSVIRRLRERGDSLPVLVLSALHQVQDRVKGLESGGDDYLVKPFAFSELHARVQALVRRSQSRVEPTSLRVANLSFDLTRRKVFRDDTLIDLQPKEMALLEYLMRHAGRVVSKTMIMEQVWDYNFDPGTNVVEARICKLREKVDRDFEPTLIHTVRGMGYVLEVAN